MKKFNLLHKTTILIIAFIAFGFIHKKENITISKKSLIEKTPSTSTTNKLLLTYTSTLGLKDRIFTRDCISSILGVTIKRYEKHPTNPNTEILTLNEILIPTLGLDSTDSDKQLPPPESDITDDQTTINISEDQLLFASTYCDNVLLITYYYPLALGI